MTSLHPAAPLGAADRAARPFGVAGWDLRVVRAVPFALVCTLIAALGHCVAGGAALPLSTLALGFVAVCAVAALLGGRERSLAGIAGALGIGQLGLHLLFHSAGHTAMAGMTGMTRPLGAAGTAGLTLEQVAGRLLCNDAPGAARMLPPGISAEQLVGDAGLDPQAYHSTLAAGPWWAFGLTPAMLAGHLVAAVLAGWWLRRGEAALWRLVRLTGRAAARELGEWTAPLHRALALVAAVLRGLLGAARLRVRTARPDSGSDRLPLAAALRHSVIRRGPPVAAFAH
ncbi:hypothetical protein [Kitasatospora azatica]|uniref:hypothetical protein n=1 Tax=Kitasatospora azatica TaxID=58347 RepID=UPI00068B5FF7|nr:hypothetical protein [Kitasatospora azatica]